MKQEHLLQTKFFLIVLPRSGFISTIEGHGLCSKRMRRSEEKTQLWEDLIIGPSDPTPNTKNKAN